MDTKNDPTRLAIAAGLDLLDAEEATTPDPDEVRRALELWRNAGSPSLAPLIAAAEAWLMEHGAVTR